MGESRNEIENHIEATRVNLNANLRELETRVKAATDVRAHFERRPLTFASLAFGGGIIAAALLRRTFRV